MEYRVMGRTGVRLSVFGIGGMMFGPWGNPDVDECRRMIDVALDAGITLLDTADVYSGGESEEIIGGAVRGRRDEIVLATMHSSMSKRLRERGNSRLALMRAVEGSLRRLGTDHIDIYQLHRPDPKTDIEETLAALDDLVRQGKVRYVGTSAFPGWQLVEAHWTSERHGLVRFACEQPPYSIFTRDAERHVFEVTQRYAMGVLVWSPLAGGWLTGKYRKGRPVPEDSRIARAATWGPKGAARYHLDRPGNQRKLELLEELAVVAGNAGLSLTHMSIAFTLAHPAVTSTIVGPRTMEQLQDLLSATDVQLGSDVLDAIDAIVPPGTVVERADRAWNPPWMGRRARRRGETGARRAR
ncbi:MAG TPA: aldo/keto reductase [Actinomycetota bacterium]|jgi:aryl-alcohol dehydrogenase-like predicted oxidoreductase